MCGRFTLSTPPEVMARLFDLDQMPEGIEPRYNVAPTQPAPVVRVADDGGRRMELFRWGLIPSWADDPKIGSRMINARAETVAEKPSFRRSLRSRRCLVPADGFYEWATTNGGRQPYLFRMADGSPFAFAGLWDTWSPKDGEPVSSFTIITTAANDVVRPVHERMPAVLVPDAFAPWLDPGADDPAELTQLLVPLDPSLLVGFPVDRRVNSSTPDDPELVRPMA